MTLFEENLVKASHSADFLVQDIKAASKDGRHREKLAKLEEAARKIKLELIALMGEAH